MRRRALLLMTMMAVALVVAGGMALAANITCPNSIGNLCVGTKEADTMTGTDQADEMRGRGGGDTMHARDGDDTPFGGAGNDEILAGLGDDSSVGGAGDDSLSGGNGDDTYSFSADWGADRIPEEGEGTRMGADTLDFYSLVEPLDVDLVVSYDREEVFSDAGMLNFAATVEIENVTGGQTRDVVRGNDARNRFFGNGGNDRLVGRENNDVLSGGLGPDALDGGTGNDVLNGGDDIVDSDVYLFQDSWGVDRITDVVAGPDRLFFGELTRSVNVDLVSGKAYETEAGSFELSPNRVNWTPGVIHSVSGGTAADVLSADNSGNTLNGQGGGDKIYGRGGNDKMFGGPGVDTVYGDHPDSLAETGDDTVDVADGDAEDTVDCGPDATVSGDTVYVDAGDIVVKNPDGTYTCENILNPPS
jgi:Ca2+-binding RTX toxin-like protein